MDRDAEFLYVGSDAVAQEAKRIGATPYDVKAVELAHHGAECCFDAFVHRYERSHAASRPILHALYAYCRAKVGA